MMVIGFLAAVTVIRRLSRDITPDPEMITNASLYALIAGVVGARLFYVIHYKEKFAGDWLSVFAIWQGGLELLGGVIAAIAVIILYIRRHKLPARQYLDILAIGLMLALVFGRIGCLLNGCCFGKPADLPWAVRFPYDSLAYRSQTQPDLGRSRPRPYIELPADFSTTVTQQGLTYTELKSREALTTEQEQMVTKGAYRCLPVHPTQLYGSAKAAVLCAVLYFFWRRSQKQRWAKNSGPFAAPGSTFALMFIVYGVSRFFLEFLRDDNPFEHAWWTIYKGGTISQNLSIYMFLLGLVLMAGFNFYAHRRPDGKSEIDNRKS